MKMNMAIARKAVAIRRGTQDGSSRTNNALKANPMPVPAKPVLSQLAKVRSLARIVRSSARSVLAECTLPL